MKTRRAFKRSIYQNGYAIGTLQPISKLTRKIDLFLHEYRAD